MDFIQVIVYLEEISVRPNQLCLKTDIRGSGDELNGDDDFDGEGDDDFGREGDDDFDRA